MKKQLSIFASLFAIIFVFANFSPDKENRVILTVVNEEPVLPEQPFEYIVSEVPDHLLIVSGTINLGYQGRIDTISLSSITNDKATLGRVLFYDNKLSALENISCGSCHDQSLSFTENKPFSEGISSLTQRNSMHLNDLGWSNNQFFSWDMEITDLHEMIKLPLTDENEIGANMLEVGLKLESTSYYPKLFESAFGDDDITEARVIDALVQFIKSMTTFNSRLDREAEKGFSGFTDQENLGRELFKNCSTCHTQGVESFFGGIEPIGIFPFLFNNGLPEDEDDKGAGEWNVLA